MIRGIYIKWMGNCNIYFAKANKQFGGFYYMVDYEYVEIDEVTYKVLKSTYYKEMEIAVILEEGGDGDV